MLATRNLLEALVEARIVFPSGVPGIMGRSGLFEDVLAGVAAAADKAAGTRVTERVHFPPGMSRQQFEASGYLKNFPNLAGTVHAFCGNDADHLSLLDQLARGEDWTAGQRAGAVVLTPATCYPVYPMIAARGPLAKGGAFVSISGYCFRNEPSEDPTRVQFFRQREFVCIGTAEQATAFRNFWHKATIEVAERLQLPAELVVANDPFFGRAGKLSASVQREQALKHEVAIPVVSDTRPTACMSVNYHQDYFARANEIRTDDGEIAHSACVGFGLERLTLALFRHHGLDTAKWPECVRAELWE
ncbi:MAG: amino acid--[acyl-carrier-protein] ligase [Proteobacteria bacterium]|nr:amino acid--[acyl-carrier-protein] ligase [Pseudomonadota bacterium]